MLTVFRVSSPNGYGHESISGMLLIAKGMKKAASNHMFCLRAVRGLVRLLFIMQPQFVAVVVFLLCRCLFVKV